jgi:hypothetical protein
VYAAQAVGLEDISIPDELLQHSMDLRPFMQRHPFTINQVRTGDNTHLTTRTARTSNERKVGRLRGKAPGRRCTHS